MRELDNQNPGVHSGSINPLSGLLSGDYEAVQNLLGIIQCLIGLTATAVLICC